MRTSAAAARIWIVRGALLWGAIGFAVAAARPSDEARGALSWLLAALLAAVALPAGLFALLSGLARWFSAECARCRYRLLACWAPAGILIYVAGFLVAPDAEHWNRLFGRLFWPLTIAVIALGADALAEAARGGELWLLLAGVLAALLIGEAGARLWLRHAAENPWERAVFDPAQTAFVAPKFSPHHYEAYIPRPEFISRDGLNRHNALGFRGEEIIAPKPAGTFRIAALGGSTTYDTGVRDWREAYPAALESELITQHGLGRVEVINAGVPGHDMAEILINLEFRVLDLQPDLVIVYENTNDVAARIVPPAAYRGDNAGRRRVWDSDAVARVTSPLMRLPSALLRIMSINFRWLGDGGVVSLDTVVDVPCTGNSAGASCLGMSVEEALAANPPVYFERRLRGIAAIARSAGVRLMLMTWAHNPLMNDYAGRPEMEAAFAQHNGIIARIAREEEASFFDFAPLMPRDRALWADGRHMTAEGNKVRARLIAGYLVGEGLIPKD